MQEHPQGSSRIPIPLRPSSIGCRFGLRQKWYDIADNITENQQREIAIEDLSNFVITKAWVANQAVFGDLSNNVSPQSWSSRVKPKPARSTSTFATQTRQAEGDKQRPPNPTRLKCPLCNTDHWLSQCDKFRNKSLADWVKFVCTKNVCNNCLVAGHLARSHPKPRFCRVTIPASSIQQVYKILLTTAKQVPQLPVQGPVNHPAKMHWVLTSMSRMRTSAKGLAIKLQPSV